MKQLRLFHLLCLFGLLSISACDWSSNQSVQEWLDLLNPPDPIVQDTVCTTYDPVLLPEFVGAYMLMDPYQGDRILSVYPYSDTIHPGEDIGHSLDSMLQLLYPQYTIKVYVNDTDDRLISVIMKGTNDKTKLLGKLWVRYNGFRHYFGAEPQSLLTFGSMTFDEMYDAYIEFPSFRYTNHQNMVLTPDQHNKLDEVALDSLHCKGGRDWYDFFFREHPPQPEHVDYALVAGWPHINHGIGEAIEITGRADLWYYLDRGYMVKVRE